MSNRLFLVAVIVVSCFALIGGGGGGGGSNLFEDTEVSNARDTAKAVLKPHEENIREAYDEMESILMNNAWDENQRIASFMSFIAPDFKDLAGNAKRQELQETILSRIQRYNVNNYSFEPLSFIVVNENTLKVSTKMSIKVTKKAGGISIEVPLTRDVTWQLQQDGKWRIHQGLPYLRSEIEGP